MSCMPQTMLQFHVCAACARGCSALPVQTSFALCMQVLPSQSVVSRRTSNTCHRMLNHVCHPNHVFKCSSNVFHASVARLPTLQRPSCRDDHRCNILVEYKRKSYCVAAASSQQAAADRADVPNSTALQASATQQQPRSAQLNAQESAAMQAAPQHRDPQLGQRQEQDSSPSVQHSTYSSDADVVEGNIKIIGLGQRGISATSRLMGNKSMQGAEFWVLDTDAKVLSSCGAPNTMCIPVPDDAQLSPAELTRLAGEAAVAAAAAAPTQRPGSPVATCGVAFLLAGAGGIPGGPTLFLQVAAYLRRIGYFVVAALTRPFEFEGRRKLEEADALFEALQDVAQLVVVVPQGVLTRASAELTINEASAIADNTLEVSCRAILWALRAPEVLRASAGTMLWHGRDLRQYKRLLSPPLEVLLTCPGVGGLGRGLASLPVTSLAEAGLASGLSTLAEDAVAAAVESPFLEHAMPRASGVLCVLSLPARVLSHNFSMATDALNDPEKYAIRAAVQVAAMTVVDLAGKHCEEVVVCAHVRPDWPHTDPNLLCLEATLLVLEDPSAAEQEESGRADHKSYPFITHPRPPSPQSRLSHSPKQHGPILHSMQLKPQQQPGQQRAGSSAVPITDAQPAAGSTQPKPAQQQPSAASIASNRSTWSAMSAIAGGSAAAAVGHYKRKAAPSQFGAPATQQGAGASRSSSSRGALSGTPDAGSSTGSIRPLFNIFGNAPSTAAGAGAAGGSDSSSGGGSLLRNRLTQASQQQQQQLSSSGQEVTFVPRMADKHVDTMVSQSLDLPPSAARWRHQQRRQAPQPKRSHFPLPVVPWSGSGTSSTAGPGSQGGSAAVEDFVGSSHDLDEQELDTPRDVRSRVAGMLQQERRDGWAFDQED